MSNSTLYDHFYLFDHSNQTIKLTSPHLDKYEVIIKSLNLHHRYDDNDNCLKKVNKVRSNYNHFIIINYCCYYSCHGKSFPIPSRILVNKYFVAQDKAPKGVMHVIYFSENNQQFSKEKIIICHLHPRARISSFPKERKINSDNKIQFYSIFECGCKDIDSSKSYIGDASSI